MTERALIIVDMLNDFVDEKGALYCGKEARAIIPFIQKELSSFRKRGDLVIFLQDSHTENDREFERFPRHCVRGSWGNAVIAELSPRPDEMVIAKTRFSGFFGTDLEKRLADARVEDVEVVGVCTSICVMDTVGGLADRDYIIRVPRGGVADFDAEFHEFSLKRMRQIYGAEIV